MKLQESGEMYLETIWILKQDSPQVRSIDIASHTGYSKPSVSRAVGLLKEEGYVTVDKHGHISFTEKGDARASGIYERHTFLTDLFVKMGVPHDIASQDACKMEHGLSDETFRALKKFTGKL